MIEKIYQTLNKVFRPISKLLDARQQYSATRRIFNFSLGVSCVIYYICIVVYKSHLSQCKSHCNIHTYYPTPLSSIPWNNPLGNFVVLVYTVAFTEKIQMTRGMLYVMQLKIVTCCNYMYIFVLKENSK